MHQAVSSHSNVGGTLLSGPFLKKKKNLLCIGGTTFYRDAFFFLKAQFLMDLLVQI